MSTEEDWTQSNVSFYGFALSDCLVQIENHSAKYLRAVHRTALELATQNSFGTDMGGFWLLPSQIEQLRKLPEYYPANEAALVKDAVEAYLRAQLENLYAIAPPTKRS
jgi:hypothetical protein